ncbi:MAG: hypothetical protein RBR95_11860 [Ignavibacteriaceae bacterium]|jgi:HEAT repeat protein|nr:hypothetical protein [Ignavibacteriaceae bacterium]
MNKSALNKMEKLNMLCILLIIFLVTGISSGQTTKLSDLTCNKYALKNLEMGIESENQSVRKSAVYFAGKYKVTEAEDVLIRQLKAEPESEIRILIGLALFRMNSEKGMEELHKLVSSDVNPKVRKMCCSIYTVFLQNKLNGDDNG